MVLFSNVNPSVKPILYVAERLRGGGGPIVRDYFPETWIWESIDSKTYASIAQVPP